MLKSIELTSDQNTHWENTRVSLLRHCPAFSHILYTLLDNTGGDKLALFTKDVWIAATDGRNLIINPETFFALSLNERVFVMGHEILHCALNHINLFYTCQKLKKVVFPSGEELPYVPLLLNVAADYVVNALLVESRVGKLNPQWYHDPSIATSKDSVLDVYKKLHKQYRRHGGKGQGSGSSEDDQPDSKRFDQHLQPGASEDKHPQDAVNQRNESQWRSEIQAAMQVAKLKGEFPLALERVFGDVIEPQVSWNEHINSYFARREGPGAYDWRKPDRRLITRDIYAPARSSRGAGTIVLGVDTSGSIQNPELSVFAGCLGEIFEQLKPKELYVVWCDAEVHRMDEIEDMSDFYRIKKEGGLGGGGTDFRPVFEHLDKLGIVPDCLVYCTDGFGTFPSEPPRYDVLWAATTPGVSYPFGNVIWLPMGNAASS